MSCAQPVWSIRHGRRQLPQRRDRRTFTLTAPILSVQPQRMPKQSLNDLGTRGLLQSHSYSDTFGPAVPTGTGCVQAV